MVNIESLFSYFAGPPGLWTASRYLSTCFHFELLCPVCALCVVVQHKKLIRSATHAAIDAWHARRPRDASVCNELYLISCAHCEDGAPMFGAPMGFATPVPVIFVILKLILVATASVEHRTSHWMKFLIL